MPRHSLALVAAMLAACSSAGGANDASRDTSPPIDTGTDAPDTSIEPVDVVDATRDAHDVTTDTPIPCSRGTHVDELSRCIDTPRAPNDCLATITTPLCDDDADGLADDLEDALGRSYALAFAYNQGDGSRTGGNPEPHWPDNLAHYTANSHLIWRVDGDNSTMQMVQASPTLDSLATATVDVSGTTRHANDPALSQGSSFWLCLDQPGGNYTTDSLVTSMDASRQLAGGVDVANVVHPAGGVSSHAYAFVATMLFYPYNEHSMIDNHEGDWEGGAVLVDLASGNVVALYLDRHDSGDNVRLLPIIGPSAYPVIDPSTETTFGNICDDAAAQPVRGVRFFDYGGARHHAVAYVATGGHSAYPYPGNTKITGAGCFEWTIVRDTHNGDGPRFLPWRNAYVTSWSTSPSSAVVNGVHFRNAGETRTPRDAWANFRGQWGCQHDTVAKSWPGPFGNQRHCRAWLTTDGWGEAPFTTPTTGCP